MYETEVKPMRKKGTLLARDARALQGAHEHHELPALMRRHRIGISRHRGAAVADGAVEITVGQILADPGDEILRLGLEQMHDGSVAVASVAMTGRAVGGVQVLPRLDILGTERQRIVLA